MNKPETASIPRKYRWPWFVLAAVVLGLVLAVLAVAFAARKVSEQRDYNAPMPTTSPTH